MAYRQGQKSYRAVYPTQTTTDAGVVFSVVSGPLCLCFEADLHERAVQLNRSTTSGDLLNWAAPLTARPSPYGLYAGLSVRFSVAIGSSVG